MKGGKLSIIGCGNLGSSILRGLIQRGEFGPRDITICGRDSVQLELLQNELGVAATQSVKEAYKGSPTVILAVKPGDMSTVLTQCGVAGRDKTIISVATAPGISTIRDSLGAGVSIVRANPNIGSAIGLSMTSLFSEDGEAIAIAERIFNSIGLSLRVDEERHLDTCSAIAASGPAFLYLAAQGMIDGAVKMGLPREVARVLVMQTFVGAGALSLETELDCEALQARVITPGGTTIEGMEQLEVDGVRGSFLRAVVRTTERMAELRGGLDTKQSSAKLKRKR